MKRMIILLLATSTISLFGANDLTTLYGLYKNGDYKTACRLGLRIFDRYKKNSKFLMLYGFSCLKADYIDRLAVPMTGLRRTKTERANASYFATIILQKKLLYHALLDQVDISDLRLPKTDYILSKIFDMYTKGSYKKIDGKYFFIPKGQNGLYYVLYIERGHGSPKMVVEERIDDRLIKIHRYW